MAFFFFCFSFYSAERFAFLSVVKKFSRGAPKRQWIHRLRRCHNRDPGCPEVTYSAGSAHSAKNDVEGPPHAGENPLQVPMDSREGHIVSLS